MNKQAVFDKSTTALGDGLTFTGPWRATEGYSRVSGTVFADHASTVTVEWSGDATNADGAETGVAVTASTATKFGPYEVIAPYVRVKCANSAGAAQTVLRLFPLLKEQN